MNPSQMACTVKCETIACDRPARYIFLPHHEPPLHACRQHAGLFVKAVVEHGLRQPRARLLWCPAEVRRAA